MKARSKRTQSYKPTAQTAPLAGDVETLCSILANIVTRVMGQQSNSTKANS
ncbi:MAG: hypothetical protein WCF84_10365 [Anaerolineae bacterium]